jgi:hypothetical protein
VIGDEPENTAKDRSCPRLLCRGAKESTPRAEAARGWSTPVCLTVKPVGEPDAGDRHVRFDERGWETGRCRMAQATAPILDSTIAPWTYATACPLPAEPDMRPTRGWSGYDPTATLAVKIAVTHKTLEIR